MDFSLTTLFVVPAGNTLPTTGNSSALVPNRLGVYKDDNAAATVGNIATSKYIYIAQGRQQDYPGVGTKKSDKIYLKNLIDFYKVEARETAAVQITDITDFSAVCGEQVTISLRLKSFYLDTAVFNGFTRSFTIQTPCCECGDNPCENVDEEDLIDQFVTLINGDTSDLLGVGNYLIAEKLSAGGGNFKLRLTGIPLTPEGVRCDPSAFPYQYDRMYFWAFPYKGPATSVDYNVWDACDPFATATTIQTSTFPLNSSLEISQMEKDYWSYNMPPIAKELFRWDIWNNGYTSQVVDGTFYDLYFIKFNFAQDNQWNPAPTLDETVIIAVPTGEGASLETLLETYLGTAVDESAEEITTTTTTSTTSTSTTTSTTSSTTTTTTTI